MGGMATVSRSGQSPRKSYIILTSRRQAKRGKLSGGANPWQLEQNFFTSASSAGTISAAGTTGST